MGQEDMNPFILVMIYDTLDKLSTPWLCRDIQTTKYSACYPSPARNVSNMPAVLQQTCATSRLCLTFW